jgi:hypothetical protein
MKSRNISILDYLNTLQKEFFCAELRYKIYTQQADKDYWRTIMTHKQNKIEDIALRNKLKSIFTDKREYLKIFEEVLCFGVPNFTYRDYYQQTKLQKRDTYFYFQPGSDVKYINESGVECLGKIKKYSIENQTVTIETKSEPITINIKNVCRII